MRPFPSFPPLPPRQHHNKHLELEEGYYDAEVQVEMDASVATHPRVTLFFRVALPCCTCLVGLGGVALVSHALLSFYHPTFLHTAVRSSLNNQQRTAPELRPPTPLALNHPAYPSTPMLAPPQPPTPTPTPKPMPPTPTPTPMPTPTPTPPTMSPLSLPAGGAALCAAWCSAHPAALVVRCTFAACSGCDACTLPGPPPSPSLPPRGAVAVLNRINARFERGGTNQRGSRPSLHDAGVLVHQVSTLR